MMLPTIKTPQSSPKHQSLVYNAAIRTAEYIVCYEGHSRKIIPPNNIHTLHAEQHAF